MKGQSMMILVIIIAAIIIAFAVAQGQINTIFYVTNITTNNTINNSEGVSIPQANITDGITVPNDNVTGGWILPYENITGGIPDIPWDNITDVPGFTLPAGNITNATNFTKNNFTFNGNLTIIQRICLDTACLKFIWSNGTHIIINNSG